MRFQQNELIFAMAKTFSFRFSNAVRDLEVWQKGVLLLLIPGVLLICGIIGREIFFAINPDKRPRKRRRRTRD